VGNSLIFQQGALKKFAGAPPAAPLVLPHIHHGMVAPEPAWVECTRLAHGVRQLLVHWRGEPPESATWEDVDAFREQFPDFQLEDELDLEEGRDVMCGIPYTRRRRARDVRRAAERAAARAHLAREEDAQPTSG